MVYLLVTLSPFRVLRKNNKKAVILYVFYDIYEMTALRISKYRRHFMKRISILCASIIAANIMLSIPQTNVVAANDAGFTIYSSEGNPNLNKMASSLGADTDCFNFANYNSSFVGDEMKNKFVKNITKIEAIINKIGNANDAMKGGECSGISILEILVHNGIISASDIQKGAENLVDITFDDSINDILSYYQMSQVYMYQDLYGGYYFCNHDTEEAISNLVETAEKSMSQNKYFYISILLPTASHAVTGIGIADGNWEINGRIYNKCILTLDSNYVGFNEKGCIYVNSEENTFCFPTYSQTEEKSFIRTVSDDETWLNYKGLFSPSSECKTDISQISKIEIDALKIGDYDFSVQEDDNIQKYSSNGKNPILDITPNNFINLADGCYQYYIDGSFNTIFKLEAYNDLKHYETGYIQLFDTNETTRKYCYSYKFKDKSLIEMGNNYISISTPSYNEYVLDLSSENGPYNNEFFCNYHVIGNSNGSVKMIERNDGILLETSCLLQCTGTFSGPIVMEDGSYKYDLKGMNSCMVNFTSSQNTVLRYDEEKEMIRLFLDKNGDNEYDEEVQKGDVNCDGYINAVDASIVLSAYARYSTEEIPYIPYFNDYYGDYDNNGIINAIDASEILSIYAQNSVS